MSAIHNKVVLIIGGWCQFDEQPGHQQQAGRPEWQQCSQALDGKQIERRGGGKGKLEEPGDCKLD